MAHSEKLSGIIACGNGKFVIQKSQYCFCIIIAYYMSRAITQVLMGQFRRNFYGTNYLYQECIKSDQ